MSKVPGSKTNADGQQSPSQVRRVRGDRAAETLAQAVQSSHRTARPLQQETQGISKAKIKLIRDKNYVAIRPTASVERLTVRTRLRHYEIHQIPAMEMQKKRKKEVKGMPIYFSLAAAEHKIYLFPVPDADINAEIEYKPYEVK